MRGLTITPAVLGLLGLALLVFESVQAMRSVVLGTVGTIVLFVGLGLLVIAAALLLVGISTEPLVAAPTGDSDEPAEAPAPVTAPSPPPRSPAVPDVAANWSTLCRTESAGELDAGELHESLRRGATLVVYTEGVLIGVGKTQQHRSWPQVTAVAATLGGNKATITVHFDTDDGAAKATFTGKSGELAPAATALVSAAPANLVNVTYS